MGDHHRYWIGFNLIKGIGPARIRLLLDHFGDIESAWNASSEDLRAAGLSQDLCNRLIRRRSELDLDREWSLVNEQGFDVVCWEDPDYPASLKHINHPPPILYLAGRFVDADKTSVAVVGTRRPTSYGKRLAQELGMTLARAGITVVSGLARGVDAEAHREALRAGGRTVAVLGSGLDRIYPPENRGLTQNIQKSGVVMSDYPLGTPPEAVNFPPRNRIISGLSRAVVVVEAGGKSGAMITASFAADQGREVFAAPGSIYSPQSTGTNSLIRQGARPLTDPAEILEFLNINEIYNQPSARPAIETNNVEEEILEIVRLEPLYIDEIGLRTRMRIEELTATLVLMELKGLVRKEAGKRYTALQEASPAYDLA